MKWLATAAIGLASLLGTPAMAVKTHDVVLGGKFVPVVTFYTRFGTCNIMPVTPEDIEHLQDMRVIMFDSNQECFAYVNKLRRGFYPSPK